MAPKRDHSGPCSAARANTPLAPLSADLVFEILSWLSVRSLSRCPCVCTSWRALISEPALVAMHRPRAEPLLVTVTDSTTGTATTLRIIDAEGDVVRLVHMPGLRKFRASLDGLVLLTSRFRDECRAAIRVIDLATGGTITSRPKPADATDLVTTWFGFGRAARSNALTVIRIVCRVLSTSYLVTCEALTLGRKGAGSTWRETRLPPAIVHHGHRDGVAVNGALHFLSICLNDILCFNLESEVWTAIRGPSGIPRPREDIGLVELNGALCMTHAEGHTVSLWLLHGVNKDVWVKAYRIRVIHLPTDLVANLVPLRVMRPAGKLLFYCRPAGQDWNGPDGRLSCMFEHARGWWGGTSFLIPIPVTQNLVLVFAGSR